MFDKDLKNAISQIAADHHLEPETLLAVVEVESGGKLGAMVNGRMEPLIRFEGHYFYRLLPAYKRNVAVTRGLASSVAGRVKNPWLQSSRWRLLKRAQAVDRPSALASVSWGAGQVMGSHWRWLGYASIDALVTDARNGADGQVRLMMRFIKKAKLLNKLYDQDWSGFARSYNGPNFRKHRYDTKLANAYLRHCKEAGKPDITRQVGKRNSVAMLRYGSMGFPVRMLQTDLSRLGIPLYIDGDFGPATEMAVKQFQTKNRLIADGIYGPKTMEVLRRKLPPALI